MRATVLLLLALVGIACCSHFSVPVIPANSGPNLYTDFQFECNCGPGWASGRPCTSENTGGRGCEDLDCCRAVCSYDRGQCCTSEWDAECTKLALWKQECTYDNTFCTESSFPVALNGFAQWSAYHHNFHGATHQSFRDCHLIGASVWYKFYSPQVHHLNLDICNSTFDNVVAIYKTSGGCPSNSQAVIPGGCIDDCNVECGFGSITDFWTEPGETYWIQVGGFDASRGWYDIRATDNVGLGGVAWYYPAAQGIFRWSATTPGDIVQLTDWDQNDASMVAAGFPELLKEGDVSFIEIANNKQALVSYDAANEQWVAINSLDMTPDSMAATGGCIRQRMFYDNATSKLYHCTDGTTWEVITQLTMDPWM